jgi:hypothetical protein
MNITRVVLIASILYINYNQCTKTIKYKICRDSLASFLNFFPYFSDFNKSVELLVIIGQIQL